MGPHRARTNGGTSCDEDSKGVARPFPVEKEAELGCKVERRLGKYKAEAGTHSLLWVMSRDPLEQLFMNF